MSFKNQIIKTNYHSHVYLCGHAVGNVEDYVKEAIKHNFKIIGISDHAPWQDLVQRSLRMQMRDYPIYLDELNHVIEKYSNKIKIYKGLEIEYFNNKNQVYEKLLEDVDYLCLGQHYIEMDNKMISAFKINKIEELTVYKNTLVKAINSSYFKFICHPDLFFHNTKILTKEHLQLAEEIIIAAKEKNIPLEINANGIRKGKIIVKGKERYKYPRLEFWELVKKHDALCIVSSDAHDPKHLTDDVALKAYEFSKTLNLRVVEELSFD